MASSTRAAQLPSTVRSSSDPDRAVVKAVIDKAVALIQSNSPADQGKGRDQIVAEVALIDGKTEPSAGFLFSYAQVLNDSIKPALSSPEMRVRLNAAIAIARVAEKADASVILLPSVEMLLNDQSEAVALWGMKAARPVLKSLTGTGVLRPPPFINAIVATGSKFPSTSGAAYYALTVDTTPPAAYPLLIDAIHKLLDARVGMWSKAIAVDPEADNLACSTLSDSKWWRASTPAQRSRSLQLLMNLAAEAGKQVGQASPAQTQSISLIVIQVAKSIGATGVIDGKIALADGMKAIWTSLKITSPAPAVADASKKIGEVLQKEYPNLGGTASMKTSTTRTATTAPAGTGSPTASSK